MTMNEALRAKLISKGWNPEAVTFGAMLSGSSMYGARVRLPSGEERYFPGPFFSERGGDQIAILN